MMTEKEEFLKRLDEQIELGNKDYFMRVKIAMPDMDGLETIMNPFINFKTKRAYYERAYDDNLRLKANNDIAIVDWEIYPKSL